MRTKDHINIIGGAGLRRDVIFILGGAFLLSPVPVVLTAMSAVVKHPLVGQEGFLVVVLRFVDGRGLDVLPLPPLGTPQLPLVPLQPL